MLPLFLLAVLVTSPVVQGGVSYYIPTTPLLFSGVDSNFTDDMKLAYVYKASLYFPAMQNSSSSISTTLQTMDPGSSLVNTAQVPIDSKNLDFPCPDNLPVANLYGNLDAVTTFPAMGAECAAVTFTVADKYLNVNLSSVQPGDSSTATNACGYRTGYLSGLQVNGVFVETLISFPEARQTYNGTAGANLTASIVMGVNEPDAAVDATCDQSPGIVGLDRSNISLVGQLASQGVIDGHVMSQCGTLTPGGSNFVILGTPDDVGVNQSTSTKMYTPSEMLEAFGNNSSSNDELLDSWIRKLYEDVGSRYSYFALVKGVSVNGTAVEEPTVAVPYTFDTGIPGLLVTPEDWSALYDYVDRQTNGTAGYTVRTVEQNLGTLVGVQGLASSDLGTIYKLFPTLTFTFVNGGTVDVKPESYVTSFKSSDSDQPLFVAIVASYDTAVGGSIASEPRGTLGTPVVHHRMVTADSDASMLYFSEEMPGCEIMGKGDVVASSGHDALPLGMLNWYWVLVAAMMMMGVFDRNHF